jgi:phosphomannomutase
LQKYFSTGEINFKVANKNAAMKRVEREFKKFKILRIDGISVDLGDWWFNLRPSHTEPVLRLTIEAKTKQALRKATIKLKKLVKG